MHQHQNGYIPWRDRLFVSINEAAEIMGRSPDWVRSRLGESRLEGRRLMPCGPVVVAVASLLAFAEQTELATLRPSGRRLTLVVDNDARN